MRTRTSPAAAITGQRPRLIDEWHAVPTIWDEVRHAVDESADKGQFILTGSATPDEVADRHSGAGRIRSIGMRTLTLLERGVKAYRVSLAAIAKGVQQETDGIQAEVEDYAR